MNKLIDYKRTYTASDGEEYIFMGGNAYDTNKLVARTIMRLNQDHNGRIDRFTHDNMLADRNDIDLVMYINHIYNPFAVKEGDIIYTPSSDNYYHKSEEPTLIDGKKHSEENSTSTTMTYAENVAYLAKLGLGV